MLDNEEITHSETHSASSPFTWLSQYTHIQLFNSDSCTKSFPLCPSRPTTVQCQHISQVQMKKVQYVFPGEPGKLLLEIGAGLGNHYFKPRQTSFRHIFNWNCIISSLMYSTSWDTGYQIIWKKSTCHLQCIKKGSQNVFKPLWWNQMSILKYSDVLITALGNLTMFFSWKNRRNIRVSQCPHLLFILIGAIIICFEIKARRQKTIAMFSSHSLSTLTLQAFKKTLKVFIFQLAFFQIIFAKCY